MLTSEESSSEGCDETEINEQAYDSLSSSQHNYWIVKGRFIARIRKEASPVKRIETEDKSVWE